MGIILITGPLIHSIRSSIQDVNYPQEASGMFLEQVISQTSALPGSLRVLDLCAAPGGKALICQILSVLTIY